MQRQRCSVLMLIPQQTARSFSDRAGSWRMVGSSVSCAATITALIQPEAKLRCRTWRLSGVAAQLLWGVQRVRVGDVFVSPDSAWSRAHSIEGRPIPGDRPLKS
jgi:hypothetical protein